MDNILYIDCFSGISGDMMLAALVDLGLGPEKIRSELKKLDLEGYSIRFTETKINGLAAKRVEVKVEWDQPLRDYSDILTLLSKSRLRENIKKNAIKIFEELAKAESKVHGTDISSVHFHEIGALDSIIDITSTAIALELLGISNVFSSKVPLGRGFTGSMHGKIPIPAPATIEILKGVPVYGGGFDFEVTTPTGAAILKALVDDFRDLPNMIPGKIGIGCGTKKNNKTPNILRLIKGRTSTVSSEGPDMLFKLSTNIDDLNPEILAAVYERLLGIGALDVWISSIFMKKNRPAFELNVLCQRQSLDNITEAVFKETTTFGIRLEKIERIELKRKEKKIKLSYGTARLKLGYLGERLVTVSPEFEDCLKLHKKTNKPLKEIYRDLSSFSQENNI